MVRSLAAREKRSFCTFDFYSQDPLAIVAQYTDLDQPYLSYTSVPELELSIPENTGTFDRKELRLTLPLDDFTSRACSGVPHAPMFLRVKELNRKVISGDANVPKIVYNGRVVKTIKNFQNKGNRATFLCLPQKSRLQIPLGVPCNHQCAWTLFGGGCGALLSEHSITTSIDSTDGTEVTISDAAVAAQATDDRYWKRGYMTKVGSGLRIAIRDYDGSVDDTLFYTVRPVPSDWVGGTDDILLVAGCDKTIEVCRDRFDQEETFLGLGFAIPAYHPNFEHD